MKRKKGFTLIELLVVIGVIAILMAMLLPAISKVRIAAQKTKARAQIKALEIAIKSYETTYGVLPVPGTGGGGVDEWDDLPTGVGDVPQNGNTTDATDYDKLLQILTQADITDSTYSDAATSDLNPDGKLLGNIRQTRFLDAPEKFGTRSYVDPWGNRFVIALDLDYDNNCTVDAVVLNRTVAIYSFGPDREDDQGKTSGTDSSSTDKADDIPSWKE
jgi:prepilin-type N-terminal cleavage/methylation domain-containing protein